MKQPARASNPVGHPNAVYAVGMTETATPSAPPGWGERAGAILLLTLALALAFIGADILTGGKLTCRGCNDDNTAGA
jgi:hypothetical protein